MLIHASPGYNMGLGEGKDGGGDRGGFRGRKGDGAWGIFRGIEGYMWRKRGLVEKRGLGKNKV